MRSQKSKIWYDNEKRWGEMNMDNSVKCRWCIVPKNVEQINDYLVIITYE